MAALLSKMT